LADANILFALRNDPLTRENSIDTREIAWETHLDWLQPIVTGNKPHILLCMVERNGVVIGTVRAKRMGDGYTEISYTVDQKLRGQGLGSKMVSQFVKEFLPGKKLRAKIKKGHIPSENIIKMLGLLPYNEEASKDPDDPRPIVVWQ
jgi:hypothetical protein